jgi:hypothetical protein
MELTYLAVLMIIYSDAFSDFITWILIEYHGRMFQVK